VAVVEELGADAYTYGTLSGLSEDEKLSAPQIVARLSGRKPPERGNTVRFAAGEGHTLHVFSNKTGERLS
jgi:multiple sugar transport system ATP-binding protein